MIKLIVGCFLIITGFLDAYKYIWQAKKITKIGTAKGQSRKFINASFINTSVRLSYALIIKDCFIGVVGIVALICIINLFLVTYIYYPYRKRSNLDFKRPNLLIYSLNSLLPNNLRKRL